MAKNEAKIKFTAETGEFNQSIKKSNEEISNLRAELRLNEEQMKTNGKSTEGLEKKHELLERQLKASEEKTESLNQKLNKAIDIYGDNSSEVSKLKTQLSNARIQEEKIKQAINSCNGELKEQKNNVNDAGEGFTVMKGVVADLASNAIQTAIGKLSEFGSYLSELPEQTRELRQDMSTLTTSFDDVGLSTSTATETWKDLYSIFGEDDRAVETANNIAKIADNQKDLNTWIDITTGAWGKHQDSLPVEGLAEAAMETAKTGSVTGVLADALNWCAKEGETYGVKLKKNIEFTKLSAKELSKLTTKQKAEYEAKKKQYEETEKYNKSLKEAKSAEEKFQFALDKCTTEQERAELITNTLNDLYSESAEVYRETQGAQMEAKDATAENLLAQAELATAIEPVTTAFSELKTELLQGIRPAIETASKGMTDALVWAREHPTAVKAVAGAVAVLSVGLGGLATVVAIYTAAQWAMNSAILANPITWVVVAVIASIAALVAIIIVVIEHWDKIKAKIIEVANVITEKLLAVINWVKTNWKGLALLIVNPFAGAFKLAYDNCEGFRNKVNSVFKKIKDLITTQIKSAADKVKTFSQSIKDAFNNMKLKFPKIKMPHFKITGEFDIMKRTVPKLGVEWYAKGGIMTQPTIFGMNGSNLMGGGEAGPEAILPISTLQDYINRAFANNINYYGSQGVSGDTYNLYLDNATINDNAEMRKVAKDFVTEMVRLGGMNR